MRHINTLLKLLKFSLVTEKTTNLIKQQHYTFIVDKSFSKTELKFFFEIFFNIKVLKINSLNLAKKGHKMNKNFGFYSQYKKIYIKFQPKLSKSYLTFL
jgi:large subunit ribosomal protein L23